MAVRCITKSSDYDAAAGVGPVVTATPRQRRRSFVSGMSPHDFHMVRYATPALYTVFEAAGFYLPVYVIFDLAGLFRPGLERTNPRASG